MAPFVSEEQCLADTLPTANNLWFKGGIAQMLHNSGQQNWVLELGQQLCLSHAGIIP